MLLGSSLFGRPSVPMTRSYYHATCTDVTRTMTTAPPGYLCLCGQPVGPALLWHCIQHDELLHHLACCDKCIYKARVYKWVLVD